MTASLVGSHSYTTSSSTPSHVSTLPSDMTVNVGTAIECWPTASTFCSGVTRHSWYVAFEYGPCWWRSAGRAGNSWKACVSPSTPTLSSMFVPASARQTEPSANWSKPTMCGLEMSLRSSRETTVVTFAYHTTKPSLSTAITPWKLSFEYAVIAASNVNDPCSFGERGSYKARTLRARLRGRGMRGVAKQARASVYVARRVASNESRPVAALVKRCERSASLRRPGP